MQPGVYNIHLPIMLEGERQAVYRERKKENNSGRLDLSFSVPKRMNVLSSNSFERPLSNTG